MGDRQPERPRIEMIESGGERTLLIDGKQAMQAWETDLMHRSADLLCGFGSKFLEVGLGLGISALRIAGKPTTKRHVVVEKYAEVISLFRERNPDPPPTLKVVQADIVDHVHELAAGSLDGIFFDPFFPQEMLDDVALWKRLVPALRRALRIGGALIPFATSRPVLRWQFEPFFDLVTCERHRYQAYRDTNYMSAKSGSTWIQTFIRTE